MAEVDAAAIIERISTLLAEQYVFPEVAARVSVVLRERLGAGAFAGLDEPELAEAVTAVLLEVTDDRHLRLRYRPEGVDPAPGDRLVDAADRERMFRRAACDNFGFARVERLPGNIGYLDLRGFIWAPGAGDVAVAAMTMLARTDALVIDLRRNDGGSPAMIGLLTTYLFDAMTTPVHLNDFYLRPQDRTVQFWTWPYVPGVRFGASKPVYVLTSPFTFSAAEEFSYNLKALKRATLVGEVTRGGAHPGDDERVDEHLELFVPSGRAINPVTGTNWEGIGVEPDVPCPADRACDTAYRLALENLLAALESDPDALNSQVSEVRAALAGD